jgi:hypothetical protein
MTNFQARYHAEALYWLATRHGRYHSAKGFIDACGDGWLAYIDDESGIWAVTMRQSGSVVRAEHTAYEAIRQPE